MTITHPHIDSITISCHIGSLRVDELKNHPGWRMVENNHRKAKKLPNHFSEWVWRYEQHGVQGFNIAFDPLYGRLIGTGSLSRLGNRGLHNITPAPLEAVLDGCQRLDAAIREALRGQVIYWPLESVRRWSVWAIDVYVHYHQPDEELFEAELQQLKQLQPRARTNAKVLPRGVYFHPTSRAWQLAIYDKHAQALSRRGDKEFAHLAEGIIKFEARVRRAAGVRRAYGREVRLEDVIADEATAKAIMWRQLRCIDIEPGIRTVEDIHELIARAGFRMAQKAYPLMAKRAVMPRTTAAEILGITDRTAAAYDLELRRHGVYPALIEVRSAIDSVAQEVELSTWTSVDAPEGDVQEPPDGGPDEAAELRPESVGPHVASGAPQRPLILTASWSRSRASVLDSAGWPPPVQLQLVARTAAGHRHGAAPGWRPLWQGGGVLAAAPRGPPPLRVCCPGNEGAGHAQPALRADHWAGPMKGHKPPGTAAVDI